MSIYLKLSINSFVDPLSSFLSSLSITDGTFRKIIVVIDSLSTLLLLKDFDHVYRMLRQSVCFTEKSKDLHSFFPQFNINATQNIYLKSENCSLPSSNTNRGSDSWRYLAQQTWELETSPTSLSCLGSSWSRLAYSYPQKNIWKNTSSSKSVLVYLKKKNNWRVDRIFHVFLHRNMITNWLIVLLKYERKLRIRRKVDQIPLLKHFLLLLSS